MARRSYFSVTHGADQTAGGGAALNLARQGNSPAFVVVGPARRAEFDRFATSAEARQALRLPGYPFQLYRRTLDIVASALGLLALATILPILALLIRLDSPGPVFYRQARIGINRRRTVRSYRGVNRRKVLQPGRSFDIVKLRTMSVNAEANGPQWARANDVRVTRVGRLMRKTRLDELPQFWNVLRGDMSLIGPRPERLIFIRQLEKEIPNYCDRLLVKPGLTGLAQVRNGYDTDLQSVRRKVRYDCESIRRSGFQLDLAILLSTVRVVVKGEGAH